MSKFFEKISSGLGNTREKFQEQMNVLLDKGPNLDDDFWDGLEEALISADVGAPATIEIIDSLRDESKRKALPDAHAVMNLLSDKICSQFAIDKKHILSGDKAVLLFVGINGTGKTTTVGKIAKEASDLGINVILGSADTFRAAAIEQLEVWAERAGVEMVTRDRGSDPASVCYATIERAEQIGSDLVLIDTAGRLHTSNDLMTELQKVCNVTRKRSELPVYVVLVIDATTGQNGLSQAKEFNKFLDLDALIVTKLDGTAKGGIALAVSKELDLPIIKIGVGEQIEDLRNFNAKDFANAFIGIKSEDSKIENLNNENLDDNNDTHLDDNNIDKIDDSIDSFTDNKQNAEKEEFIDNNFQKDNILDSDSQECAEQENIQDNISINENQIEDKENSLQYDNNTEENQSESNYENNFNKDRKKGKFKTLFDTLFVD